MTDAERKQLHNELKEKYNPEGSDMRNLQYRLLTILLEFDKFCKAHNLTYSLAYGTLLGAVRHRGFIPWDDDVDVMMTREQYDALTKIVGNGTDVSLTDTLYIHKCLKPQIFLKGHGFIDLFLVDYVPKTAVKQKWKLICLQLLSWLYRCRLHYEGWKKYHRYHFKAWHIFMPIGICCSLEKWQDLYDKARAMYLSKGAVDKTKICNYTSPMQDISKIYPADVFTDTVDMNFEGYRFPCIKGYHDFLTIRYGDYMALPKSIHNHGRV